MDFKIDTSGRYFVDERYLATFTEIHAGGYEVNYLGQTFKVQSINQMLCGTKAVLCVGGNKTKKKVVVSPSPLMKEV